MNGNGKLIWWLMGVMVLLIGGLISIVTASFDTRLQAMANRLSGVEQVQQVQSERGAEVKIYMQFMCRQNCDLGYQIDDLKEAVTGKSVYRKACACPEAN